MARKRIIDPEFWLDSELAQCDYVVRLFYIGTWNFSDDYGVIPDDLQKLRAQVFPYDLSIDILPIRDRLVALKKFIPFETESKKWLFIKNFPKYQRIDRPSNWRNPEPTPDILAEYSPIAHLPSKVKLSKEKRREVKLSEYTSEFETFWKEYPNKINKRKAFESWLEINPDISLQTQILQSIEKHKASRQWQEDDGQYIPHPTTWLNKRRWEDDPPKAKAKGVAEFINLKNK